MSEYFLLCFNKLAEAKALNTRSHLDFTNFNKYIKENSVHHGNSNGYKLTYKRSCNDCIAQALADENFQTWH